MKTNKTVGNRGEDLVMGILRGRGLRCVQRIGTPVKIVGQKGNWVKIVWGEKVSGDTTALTPAGQGVLIETKTVYNRNLRYGDLRTHQPGRLTEYAEAGGLALLVWVHHSGVYVMKWPILGFQRGKSISPSYAKNLDIAEFKENETWS